MTDEPTTDLAAQLSKHPHAVACSIESDSPGWRQVFITASPYHHGDPALSSDVVVATHDGGEWCLTLWPTREAFHDDEAQAKAIANVTADDLERVAAIVYALLADRPTHTHGGPR